MESFEEVLLWFVVVAAILLGVLPIIVLLVCGAIVGAAQARRRRQLERSGRSPVEMNEAEITRYLRDLQGMIEEAAVRGARNYVLEERQREALAYYEITHPGTPAPPQH